MRAQVSEVDWYIDFVSPFAFLQAELLAREPLRVRLVCRPLLFAGLLERWGQLGPAEITPKRRFTYRHCVWKADSLGVPMRFPPVHPFNPLALLRLAIAAGSGFETCLRIFRFVFRDGHSVDESDAWQSLCHDIGIADVAERVADPSVKQALRANGDEAIARGVFGVPTLVVGTELFWGVDATDMCRDYLQGKQVFDSAEMARLEDLPQAGRRLPGNRG
jgi:2-hydroxychromene-2-carboxylate isomerase